MMKTSGWLALGGLTAALCMPLAVAQDDGDRHEDHVEVAVVTPVPMAVVELNPPDELDPDIWINRIVRRAQSREALREALVDYEANEQREADIPVDSVAAVYGEQIQIVFDPTVNWLWISAPTVPAHLRVDVANALAHWVSAEVHLSAKDERAWVRSQLAMRATDADQRARLAEEKLAREIAKTGLTEIALTLEQDRLVALREKLGEIQNEYEIEALELEESAGRDVRLDRVQEKIAGVDKRIDELQQAMHRIDDHRESRDIAREFARDADAELREFEMNSYPLEYASILRRASSGR